MYVTRMNEQNEYLFIEKIQELIALSKDRNKDWFPPLLNEYTLPKYKQWYLVFNDNKLISFSAVQSFPNDYYRIMTRLWYDNEVRSKSLIKITPYNNITAGIHLMGLQFKDFPTKKKFISMEYMIRKKQLLVCAEKMNAVFGCNWKLNSGMYLTCENEMSFSCWQNTISEIPLELKSISDQEYIRRFGNSKKNLCI